VGALAGVPSSRWPVTARAPVVRSVPGPPEEEKSPEEVESCGGSPLLTCARPPCRCSFAGSHR
jgi:hypothetical protein